MTLTPKPLPSKQQQIAATQAVVSASTTIATAIAANVITQSRVNDIVAAAINQLRAGE